MPKKTRIDVEESSGNVFADLGLPNPEQELLKAELTLQIYKVLRTRKLTQTRAGKLLGIPQPHVSDLLNGRAARVLRGTADGLPRRTRSRRGDPS